MLPPMAPPRQSDERPSAQRRQQGHAAVSAALECSQIRLLIVEDDKFQRDALRQQSHRAGFAAVHTAATGEEGPSPHPRATGVGTLGGL